VHETHHDEDRGVGIILDHLSGEIREQSAPNAAAEGNDSGDGADDVQRIDIICQRHEIGFPGHVREGHDGDENHRDQRGATGDQDAYRHDERAG